MRFITEFKVPPEEYQKSIVPNYHISKGKERGNMDMGRMIEQSFGYLTPVNSDWSRYRLEIEAFPMDTWILFKRKLFYELEKPKPDAIKILGMIKELESFGNPVTSK